MSLINNQNDSDTSDDESESEVITVSMQEERLNEEIKQLKSSHKNLNELCQCSTVRKNRKAKRKKHSSHTAGAS